MRLFRKQKIQFLVWLLIPLFFVLIILIAATDRQHAKETTSRVSDSGSSSYKETTISIDGLSFRVALADTPEKQTLGLSGSVPLLERTGMLFVFNKEETHEFWMKDMRYPLDILWINKNNKIVYIEKNVQPESFPKTFGGSYPSLFVLEIPAGSVEQYRISNLSHIETGK